MLPGYRLPLYDEWAVACRAGTTTERYCGDSDELLSSYAWYFVTSNDRPGPVASLLPNDFGLFDMLGNAAEWCHNDRTDKQSTDATVRDTLVGGHYQSNPSVVATFRNQIIPSRYIISGFRVVKTLE